MSNEEIFLSGFLLFIAVILALDLGLFNRKNVEVVSFKKASLMSFFVVALSAGFYFFLVNYGNYLHGITDVEHLELLVKKHYHPIKIMPRDFEHSIALYNHNIGIEFFTGYIIEYALSVDNIFVILLIFTSFGVNKRHYHRVLFWGIIGAIMMRFIFIFIGAALIEKFSWIMYLFGLFLIYTAINMFIKKDETDEISTDNHPVVKFANKYFRVHNSFVGNKFFVKIDGKRIITPLFLVLIIIEVSDLIFAVDSIPAIFSVTKDPYIVFFSNIFAIIGLRSMFFLLSGIVDKFRFLKVGLAVLLTFIGLKMLLHTQLESIGFNNNHSLLIIVSILIISIITSLATPEKKNG
ncbi:TerC/Alx family metal homeostasis membrane protein [Riemerella columbipharyngis]|uniref:Tellurite resistance protein TerC n=1 Tax=Riemerella columbipharyngis TaxID=1071918 RepID=A0A1G6ZIZ5_9FLAO|nr:TerC/Alx family metal homeostasis membrane protein [Riemerella columbipharyngis]SDE02392.1 tellurite resistance protein TerC [Riemerella columbipharyngis]